MTNRFKLKGLQLILGKSFLILFLVTVFSANAASPTLNPDVAKLALTCKVWGFLKYYHPVVAQGKVDWDKALLKILPAIQNTKSPTELNALGLYAIHSLGRVPYNSQDNKPKKSHFNRNFDLSWTDNVQLFTPPMVYVLNRIEKMHLVQTPYYAGDWSQQRHIFFREKTDSSLMYPDENRRLLDLFRVWNVVEYYYPNKYLTDKPWDMVLLEMIPKFQYASDTMGYHLTLKEFCTRLDDTRATLSSPYLWKYFGGRLPACQATLIESQLVITSHHDQEKSNNDDLRIGDVITAIDGVTVDSLMARNLRYISAGNSSGERFWFNRWLLLGSNDSMKISFQRKGQPKAEKIIRRYTFEELFPTQDVPDVKKGVKIISGQYGLVESNDAFLPENAGVTLDQLKGTKALIFDLRFPASSAWYAMNYLLAKRTPYANELDPDFENPGKFIWQRGPLKCGGNWIGSEEYYPGEVVVLVGETTGNFNEYVGMMLKAYSKCTVIGSQTDGSQGNLMAVPFLSGVNLYMPTEAVFYPDSSETQRIGIVPDIYVEATIEGIRNGEDEILNAAIAFLNKKCAQETPRD